MGDDQSGGELMGPTPYHFFRVVDATLRQQRLDVAEGQNEASVEPRVMQNYRGRKSMTLVRYQGHRPNLDR